MLFRSGNTQKDYVLWQEYVPNLKYNWRVMMLAKKYAVVTQRWNSPENNKVDDNGEIKQIDYLKPELLNYVRKFVDTFDFNWCAVDVVETKDGFKVLETSVGFPFWWFEKGGVVMNFLNIFFWSSLKSLCVLGCIGSFSCDFILGDRLQFAGIVLSGKALVLVLVFTAGL